MIYLIFSMSFVRFFFIYRVHFCTTKITDIKKAPVFTGAFEFGGSGEIRTHGGLAPSSVFKTGALNRSATLPCAP